MKNLEKIARSLFYIYITFSILMFISMVSNMSGCSGTDYNFIAFCFDALPMIFVIYMSIKSITLSDVFSFNTQRSIFKRLYKFIIFHFIFCLSLTTGVIVSLVFISTSNNTITGSTIFFCVLFLLLCFVLFCFGISFYSEFKDYRKSEIEKESSILINKLTADNDPTRLNQLLLKTGKKFFIDYYYQLKSWEQIDIIDFIQDNISESTKIERITAAKEIFALNLAGNALKLISELNEEQIDKNTIKKANVILQQELNSLKIENLSSQSTSITQQSSIDPLVNLLIDYYMKANSFMLNEKYYNEGISILTKKLSTMEHCPNCKIDCNISKIYKLNNVTYPNIVYKVNSIINQGLSTDLNLVILCVDNNHNLRFLTLENSNPFALCEYSSFNHLNYGQLKYEELETKINEILNIIK